MSLSKRILIAFMSADSQRDYLISTHVVSDASWRLRPLFDPTYPALNEFVTFSEKFAEA
jgi:hypothetical protein